MSKYIIHDMRKIAETRTDLCGNFFDDFYFISFQYKHGIIKETTPVEFNFIFDMERNAAFKTFFTYGSLNKKSV